jgi:ABC-2 type transport system ATP-binding protein
VDLSKRGSAIELNLLLDVEGVSKRFGSNAVLKNVSFSVREGEVLGLIGPNGAGKTTLFECLAGLTHSDAGEVKFRDRTLVASGRKKALFYLPDAIRPWADQRVSWALGFFGDLYDRPQDDVSETSSGLGLEALMRSRIGSLSKGELKRALLAIGLLTRHPLLLLDEPFDGLDLRQTRYVMALLKSHASDGRTLFLSIHQLAEASRVCERVVLLSAGEVVGEGTLEELKGKAGLSQGGLEEVFLALT